MKPSNQYDDVVKLYKQGIYALNIARLLKISRGAVDRALRIRKVFVFNLKKKKSDQQIIDLSEQGKSVKDICKKLYLSPKTVRTVLIANGFLIKEYKDEKTKKRDEKICQEYSEGESMSRIAKKLRISETTVYYAVSRIGISRLPGLQFRNERNKRIVELVKKNKTSNKVTKQMGLTKTTICDIMRIEGAPLSEIKKIEIKNRNNHICQLYKKGMPIIKIARKIKMGRHSISRILQKKSM